MVTMTDPLIHQEAFRFGTDGTESGHGWVDVQSADIAVGDGPGADVAFATVFFLRIRIAETAGATSTLNNQTVELQYSKNGGTWTNVTASSSNVQAIATSNITDGADTTERLTGGSGTFKTTNGGFDEADGVAGGANMDIAGNEYAEVLYSINVIAADVSNADTLDFRITRAGGTLMDNEATADEPRVTIDADSTQNLDPSLYTNTQTFYTPTVSNLNSITQDAVYTNTQTFYTPTAANLNTIAPDAVYTNTQTFYTPTITTGAVDISPDGVYTNTQTFYTPTVSQGGATQNLDPSLYTNTQTFYQPTVSATYDLTPSLYTNTQTFQTPTVTTTYSASQDTVYTNTQTFYQPTVSATYDLAPTLETNTQTFYTPTVTTQATIAPDLYSNSSTFFTPTVSGGEEVGGGGDAVFFDRRRRGS